jgi:uncharacterized Zn-binding protein involved in type VI secretion
MTGVAVGEKDRAGGKQVEEANDWFRLDDDPVVTVGDTVEPHGTHTPAPTMVEGEEWFLVDDTPVCRAENKANCGHATTGRQWFLLERADNGYRPYLTDPGDPCNIEHIPWIMRANGWYEGATLMDQWFSRDASTDKKPEDSDTSTIKMDWVLELDEARKAYDELMNEALWTVPNDDFGRTPLQRLCGSLRNKGFLTDQPMEFTFDTPVWTLKGRQFDDRVIRKGAFGEEPLFIFDKHGAALGQFELLLAAAGEAEPLPDGVTHRITLRKKGVFVEDQYDFEGSQFLGFWDVETHSAGYIPSLRCKWPVTNGSFRDWRDRTNRGGDYLVYSDVKQENIDPPIVFYCPSGALQP